MKKVIAALSVLITASLMAAAQYVPQDATLYYKAGNVYTTDGDIKLTKANALNYFSSLDDYENYWFKGKRLFTAGIVVSSVGAGLALGGYLSMSSTLHFSGKMTRRLLRCMSPFCRLPDGFSEEQC